RRRPAARAARLRRRRLRAAAGALPLRLLQAAQESGRRAGDHQRGRAVAHLPPADGVRLGFVLRHHQRRLFRHQHPGRLHRAGHRRDPRRLPVLFHHVGVPHHGPGPAPHLLGGDFLRRLREASLRLPGAGGRQSPPHLGAARQAGGRQQSDDVLGAAGALRGLSGRQTQVPR
ncbi:APH1A gamma secretase subunit, partial [Columba livia]